MSYYLFLNNPNCSVLLVHGFAGSGKSTFATRLMDKLWFEYAAMHERAKDVNNPHTNTKKNPGEDPRELLPLPILCNLPALESPLTNMVDEALKQEFGRDGKKEKTQFVAKVKAGNIAPIFILDGYDELSTENLGQNLYDSNDLEDYGPDKHDENTCIVKKEEQEEQEEKQGGEKTDNDDFTFEYPNPKVIILCRTELLATNAQNYFKWFVPIASDDEYLSDANNAKNHYNEIQLAKFDAIETNQFFAARACRNLTKLFCKEFRLDLEQLALPKWWQRLPVHVNDADSTNSIDQSKEFLSLQQHRLEDLLSPLAVQVQVSPTKNSNEISQAPLKRRASQSQIAQIDTTTSNEKHQNKKSSLY